MLYKSRKILCVLPLLLLAACQGTYEERQERQLAEREQSGEFRRALFLECLKSVPQGPTSVHENGDWEGIVKACASSAYYITNQRFQ